ncbi:MAG: hypothetical protein N2506_02185 [Dehalococcoidales bacterium]|nr:hypothetical protein [Dehalococcoidales bacterium]
MIILWIKRREEENPGERGRKKSFPQHDFVMKRFRLSHPRSETRTSRSASKTSLRDILNTDGHLLVPIYTVRLNPHQQN